MEPLVRLIVLLELPGRQRPVVPAARELVRENHWFVCGGSREQHFKMSQLRVWALICVTWVFPKVIFSREAWQGGAFKLVRPGESSRNGSVSVEELLPEASRLVSSTMSTLQSRKKPARVLFLNGTEAAINEARQLPTSNNQNFVLVSSPKWNQTGTKLTWQCVVYLFVYSINAKLNQKYCLAVCRCKIIGKSNIDW